MRMTDTDPNTDPVVTDPKPTDTDPVDVDALIKERDKWQALSKKHEGNWKNVSDELKTVRDASMSEAEKAIELAKEEGRKAAFGELGNALVEAELKVQAAKAGRDLPDDFAEVLNLAKLSKDGKPDADAIAKVIKTLAPSKEGSKFAQGLGIGPHTTSKGQLSRSDLKSMSHEEINKARREGRLNTLLGIE